MTQNTQMAALSAMSSNVNVGMNEVVSVFVSKYEDGLFAKKDDLSAKIKVVKREIDQFDTDLLKSVDSTQYDASVPSLGLTFKMGDVRVCWEGNYNTPKNTLSIAVEMFDRSNDRQHATYTKMIHQAISADVVSDRDLAKDQLATLNSELMEVMGLIKSVSRKERQIRGRISEMKLAESGMAELLNNSEMLQLVQIK